MFRKFNKVVVITLLTISLSVALSNEAKSALSIPSWKFYCYNPDCFECVIKGLGNSEKNSAVINIDIYKVRTITFCKNPADNAANAQGEVFELPIDFLIQSQIDPTSITKNGFAIVNVCWERSEFLNAVEAQIMSLENEGCINPNWSRDHTEIIEYFMMATLELENQERWLLDLRVFPDDEGCWNYEVLSETLIRHAP